MSDFATSSGSLCHCVVGASSRAEQIKGWSGTNSTISINILSDSIQIPESYLSGSIMIKMSNIRRPAGPDHKNSSLCTKSQKNGGEQSSTSRTPKNKVNSASGSKGNRLIKRASRLIFGGLDLPILDSTAGNSICFPRVASLQAIPPVPLISPLRLPSILASSSRSNAETYILWPEFESPHRGIHDEPLFIPSAQHPNSPYVPWDASTRRQILQPSLSLSGSLIAAGFSTSTAVFPVNGDVTELARTSKVCSARLKLVTLIADLKRHIGKRHVGKRAQRTLATDLMMDRSLVSSGEASLIAWIRERQEERSESCLNDTSKFTSTEDNEIMGSWLDLQDALPHAFNRLTEEQDQTVSNSERSISVERGLWLPGEMSAEATRRRHPAASGRRRSTSAPRLNDTSPTRSLNCCDRLSTSRSLDAVTRRIPGAWISD